MSIQAKAESTGVCHHMELPIPFVSKKNKSICIYIDYQALKICIILDYYLLPQIDNILKRFTSTHYLSCIDLKSGQN